MEENGEIMKNFVEQIKKVLGNVDNEEEDVIKILRKLPKETAIETSQEVVGESYFRFPYGPQDIIQH